MGLSGLSGTLVPIYLYNGGHGWDPNEPVTIRAVSTENAKHGPGLYTTTRLETAQGYAKGGGRIVRLTVAPLTFDTDVELSTEAAITLAETLPGLRNRRAVVRDLRDRYEDRLPTYANLVNLMLHADERNGAGKVGLNIVKALVAAGVDAGLGYQGTHETWVILYNPAKVLKVEVVKAGDPGVAWELPSIYDLRLAEKATPFMPRLDWMSRSNERELRKRAQSRADALLPKGISGVVTRR